ncbi:MAG: calcium-binding protein, partial [Planctomycetia bacterium]|nr:calcium-binding protein [Planctomycetia bacterium]
VTEGNSGTVDAVFTVTLSAASSEMVSAFYATANGTATAGSDYVTTSGTVSFAPGETSKTVAVAVNGDTALEPNETFFVNLLIPVGATLLDDQGVGTIRDDDLVLSIDDVTVTEGNSGTVDAVFTVTLSAASSDMVTADYATANGTATAGSDYVTTSGTVSFAPGETSQTVAVTVNGDLSVEPNETFFVNLSNPVGAALLDGQGVGTIQNDDVGSLRINDASVIEGNSGTVNLVFTVSLPGPAVAPVTFDFATGPAPGSSADQATAGTDYYSASGQATIPAGQSSRTIAVTVRGDTTVERHERFAVNLSNAVNASIADGQGVGTIRNDDTTIAIADTSVLEGNSGFKNAVFTVSLAQPSALSVSVRYTTINNTAIGWSDYLPQSGTLVFQPGQTQKTISISVIGDRIFENNETFFVFLNSPTNAGIVDGVAVGTILNDDGLLFGPSSFGGFSPFGRHRR